MLSWAGSIVTSLSANHRQDRSATVPHQTEFWILDHHLQPAPPTWQDLEEEPRAALIALLVRIMAQAMHPQPIPEMEENPDER
jgi:hypothetical protein